MRSRESTTTEFTVERALPADASDVEVLLDGVAAWLQNRGIEQWKPGQFAEEIRQTASVGELFVVRRGAALVGCFMLEMQNPEVVTRCLIEQGQAAEQGAHLARLAVAREASGSGLGVELLDVACALARQAGRGSLGLHCVAGNERLRRYYLEAGFDYCGDVHTRGPKGESWVVSVFERPTRVEAS